MRWVSAIAAAVLLTCAQAKADVYITIDKTQQRMSVSVDGRQNYNWVVSTGRPGLDTPSGSFNAIRLEHVYYSKKFDDAPMPNSVFFHGGYAIHGTYEEARLGHPVSHGCVRLMRANAAVLFDLVRAHGMRNTHISVYGDTVPRAFGVPMARSYQRGYDTQMVVAPRRAIHRDDRMQEIFYERPSRARRYDAAAGFRW